MRNFKDDLIASGNRSSFFISALGRPAKCGFGGKTNRFAVRSGLINK